MNLLIKILLWMFPVALPVMGFTWSYYQVQLDASATQIGNISSLVSSAGAQRLNDFLRLRVNEFVILGEGLNGCRSATSSTDFRVAVGNAFLHSYGFSVMVIVDDKGKVQINRIAGEAIGYAALPASLDNSDLFDDEEFKRIETQFNHWQKRLPELQQQKGRLFLQALQLERQGQAGSDDFRIMQNQIFSLTSMINHPPIRVNYAGNVEAGLMGLNFQGDTFVFSQPLISCEGRFKGYMTALMDRHQLEDILFGLQKSLTDRGIASVDIALLQRSPLRFETEVKYLSQGLLQEAAVKNSKMAGYNPELGGFIALSGVADANVLNKLAEHMGSTGLVLSEPEYTGYIEQLSSMSLLVFIADRESRQKNRQLLMEVSTWLLVSLFLLFFLVFLLAKNIVAPVKRLQQSVAKVEGGDLSVQADVCSKDEIGQLAEAFNRMTRALQQSEEKLTRLAREDALTGLINRRALSEEAVKERHRAQRLKTTIALAMIDLDRFKGINDRYGHAAGDRVLKEFVRIMLGVLRKTDLFSRVGGEEFVLLLPDTDLATAHRLLDTLRCSVCQTPIELNNGAVVELTFSAGVVTWPEDSGFDEALHRADEKLYQAKQNGRNNVVS